METRAHHFLIGSFALGITALIFVFIFWLSKAEFDAKWRQYNIVFEGSVSGLRKSADVLYNGLKVGEVREIELNKKDPNKVIALIRVEEETPVTADSVATLESQGLTGVAAILISGGTAKSQPLEIKPGERYAVIRSKASAFAEIFADAPGLLRKGNELLARLTALVDTNSDNVGGIITNAREVSAQLIEIGKKVDRMTGSVDELAIAAKDLVKDDARKMMADARAAAAEGRKALTELAQIVAENRPPIRAFTKNSLPETFLFIADARQLISTLDRFAQRLERSPSSLFFGDKASEYGGR